MLMHAHVSHVSHVSPHVSQLYKSDSISKQYTREHESTILAANIVSEVDS